MAKKNINKIRLTRDDTISYTVFGIVSSEPDYKLSVLINHTLGKSLKSSEPLVFSSDDFSSGFSRFTDKSGHPHATLTLFQNRSVNQTLLRKFPNIDYILVKSLEGDREQEEELYSSLLRSVKHITAVFLIDIEKLEPSIVEAITTY